jgi:xylan 1,4-beta-xylosidase
MRQATRFLLLLLLVVLFLTSIALRLPAQAGDTAKDSRVIVVDTSAAAHPFPHFWEKMFGSGRAILTLRDDYRRDLREVKGITGFEYVRFHAIFHDEVGLYDEDAQGNSLYNFSYVDQIYDGVLANGVRPFVEISFMPKKLAARDALHAFCTSRMFPHPRITPSGTH